MKTLISTTALLITIGGTLHAQADVKSAVTIYPFGTSVAAAAVSRDLAGPSARRALEGVIASGQLEAKDQTTNPAIQAQLDAAGTLAQFNAVKPIERDKQLQSKYVMLGFVENAETKLESTDKQGKSVYRASVDVTVQLVDVETGAVADSKLIHVTNGLNSGTQEPCKGNMFVKKACELAARKLNGEADRALKTGEFDTAQKALASATSNVKDAVTQFITAFTAKGGGK